jgi:hypothetical protein
MKVKIKEQARKRVNMTKSKGMTLSPSSAQRISSGVMYRIYIKKMENLLQDDNVSDFFPQDRLVALVEALTSLRDKRRLQKKAGK